MYFSFSNLKHFLSLCLCLICKTVCLFTTIVFCSLPILYLCILDFIVVNTFALIFRFLFILQTHFLNLFFYIFLNRLFLTDNSFLIHPKFFSSISFDFLNLFAYFLIILDFQFISIYFLH